MEDQDHVKTFVFLDLETSGLPQDFPSRITEIALVAAAREHILDKNKGVLKENCHVYDFLPRVLNKMNVAVYPNKMIHPCASAVSGLTNENLEQQNPFDDSLHKMIVLFMERLEKPICLVAHNGNRFDYPILQSELVKIKQILPDDVFCVDSLPGFREVLSEKSPEDCSSHQPDSVLADIKPLQTKVKPNYWPNCEWSNEEYDSELLKVTEIAEKITGEHGSFNADELESKIELEMYKLRKLNEHTPLRKTIMKEPIKPKRETPARRKILTEKAPRKVYTLSALYERITKKELINAHRAESDTLALLECVTGVGRPILEWMDKNRVPFKSIRKMW